MKNDNFGSNQKKMPGNEAMLLQQGFSDEHVIECIVNVWMESVASNQWYSSVLVPPVFSRGTSLETLV
jgi:hypothetical protein